MGEVAALAGRPRVNLSIKGVRTPALIDTGATSTFVREDLWKKLRTPLLHSESSSKTTLTANGGQINVIGRTYLPIDGTCEIQAIVLDNTLSAPLIIGADSLSTGKAVVGDAASMVVIIIN